jgi:flagellar biosynthesis anti-sigma factor FlgM
MRIDLTTSGLQPSENAGSQKTGQRGAAASGTQDSAKTGATGDSAQFSSSFDQTRIQALSAQALSAPEIREAKVSSLAQAVNTGGYTVDAAQVADSIISGYSGKAGR